MLDRIEIAGIGDTEARADSAGTTFVLETEDHGFIALRCPSDGLELLLGALEALRREALKQILLPSATEQARDTITIQ